MSIVSNFVKNLLFFKNKEKEYDFTLPSNTNVKLDEEIQGVSLYDDFNKNLDFVKVKFNSLINSDIILREFTITAKGKQYRAFLIAIDGMINSDIINNNLLRPLMSKRKSKY